MMASALTVIISLGYDAEGCKIVNVALEFA